MTLASSRADCARCAALCCVALAFDGSPLFACDKSAGRPCRHLGASGARRIHAERPARGLAGCVGYDCLGVGPIVVQEMFDGRSWRDEASRLRPMLKAVAAAREAQEALDLLMAARRLALSVPQRRALEERIGALQPPSGWRYVAAGRLAAAAAEARRFLPSLRPPNADSRSAAADAAYRLRTCVPV